MELFKVPFGKQAMKKICLVAVGGLLLLGRLEAQESIRLQEKIAVGNLYQVKCRVEITGKLSLPPNKDNPTGQQLLIEGGSAIDYDERILLEKNGKVDRTVRNYRKMDFTRKVGEQNQQSSLRSEVRCQVIMRHNQFEVPFSPFGPLTWGEIDLVRTDVFTPALSGLLPPGQVTSGDRWPAENPAVQELTDLEQILQGKLLCKFEGQTTLAQRRLARVGFEGEVKGVGEDGPTRHELEGYFFFDLESQHLSYLYVRGTQFLEDKDGKPMGKIEGSFVLTREHLTKSLQLADEALRGLVLEPNEENTLLLFDNAELGVRFLYPRRWRVAGVSGKQIALDENRGSGLLITLESLAKLPTGAQFRQETQQWLGQQKATIFRADPLKAEQGPPNQVEHFSFETELNKQRVVMDYHVLRQAQGGATLAGRLLLDNLAGLQGDLKKIVRSVQITR
jgi:hypothetical protein